MALATVAAYRRHPDMEDFHQKRPRKEMAPLHDAPGASRAVAGVEVAVAAGVAAADAVGAAAVTAVAVDAAAMKARHRYHSHALDAVDRSAPAYLA